MTTLPLPEDPWRYFNRKPGVGLLPITVLRPTRARPTGIENAAKFMFLAYEGKKSKRDPISVRDEQDGTYSILDGNSTFIVAQQNGWQSIPVIIKQRNMDWDLRLGYRPQWQDTPGYKTVVDNKSTMGILPSQQESKTDKGQGNSDAAWPVAPGEAREKERALPLPSNHDQNRDTVVGPTYYNKNQKTPYRTLSQPGEQYGHPTKYDYNYVTRRPGVTGSVEVTAGNPLPDTRQRNQSPAYQRVTRNYYKRNRAKKKLKQRQEYRLRGKRDPQQKKYRKYYRQYPSRYKRKGRSPFTTPAERTKAWRETQKQDAHQKGMTPKQQETSRKRTPRDTKSRKPKTPGGTSKVYASFVDQWAALANNWPVDWSTHTKHTQPPDQLDQNHGKDRNRDTGTPRNSPGKQEGESSRAPNLDSKPQPGLRSPAHPPASSLPSVQVNNPTSGSGKVIPLSYYTDIVNNTQQVPDGRQDRYLRNNNFDVKQASTLREILQNVDREIPVQARDRVPTLIKMDLKNWTWHWKSGKWKVKVQAFQRGKSRKLSNLHLRVSCNCPFWQWQGPEHWAKKGDYLLGAPRGSASRPNVRDPDHVHPVCKHVYAVLERSKAFVVQPENYPLRKLGSDTLAIRVAVRYLVAKRRLRDAHL